MISLDRNYWKVTNFLFVLPGLYLNILETGETLQFWDKKFSTCVARGLIGEWYFTIFRLMCVRRALRGTGKAGKKSRNAKVSGKRRRGREKGGAGIRLYLASLTAGSRQVCMCCEVESGHRKRGHRGKSGGCATVLRCAVITARKLPTTVAQSIVLAWPSLRKQFPKHSGQFRSIFVRAGQRTNGNHTGISTLGFLTIISRGNCWVRLGYSRSIKEESRDRIEYK